ncbi:hypothetical protein IMSHALPRED_008206 [Imshaugia aleurites]|uniref:Uncharacterized protein n=1 Tax=Imshaugia aleurites TaxID=172621 RepID=A0A8H3IRD6_9LECA|nr:hypothetical protein IMSHALPRED_008206 [Imshaugia aleurites]
MYNVPSFTLARAIGGLVNWYWRIYRGREDTPVVVLASGLILGEGVLENINNSTNAIELVSIVIALLSPAVTADQHNQLQDLVTNLFPQLLAQSQENNRALKNLCDFTQHQADSNFYAAGSNVMVPSMLGIAIAVMVVTLVNMVDHFA